MRNSILIILLFASSSIFGQTESKKENYKPVNLEEAVEQLKIIHHDSTKQKILNMTEDEFIGGAHMGLGMWMRKDKSNFEKQLADSFDSANCDPCVLQQTKITTSPIKYLFDKIEEGDVFAITKAEKDFQVELYRETE